jgi:hypothetical protein
MQTLTYHSTVCKIYFSLKRFGRIVAYVKVRVLKGLFS